MGEKTVVTCTRSNIVRPQHLETAQQGAVQQHLRLTELTLFVQQFPCSIIEGGWGVCGGGRERGSG